MYPIGNIPEMPGLSMSSKFIEWEPLLLWSLLLLIWFVTPGWLRYIDPTIAVPDNGIWLLIILSLIAFLILLGLCLWLLHLFLVKTGLPALSTMVSQFKTLMLWQQLGFYFACLALLLLAASTCLVAIC